MGPLWYWEFIGRKLASRRCFHLERSELINWILKLQISAQSHHPYVRPSPSGDLKTNILVVTSPLLHLPPWLSTSIRQQYLKYFTP